MSRQNILTRKQKKAISTLLTYLTLILVIFLIDLPVISMIGTALKPKDNVMSSLSLLPTKISLENFRFVFANTNFFQNILSSLKIAGVVTITCIIVSSFAAYAVSRYRGKVFSIYSTTLLALQMFPGVLVLIPLFVLYRNLGLINTHFSVFFSYTTINLPFSVWMLKGFFDTIPFELEESALIDGCSRFGSFVRIIVPISMPGISSVAIFTFINCWNEYLLASIFLRSDSVMTYTVGLQKFTQQFTTDWGALMAASTVSTIPVLIFLLLAQKYLIQGLTAGAVKG